MAFYGLARSLRLPWWAWGVMAMCLTTVAAPVFSAWEGSCPAGESPEFRTTNNPPGSECAGIWSSQQQVTYSEAESLLSQCTQSSNCNFASRAYSSEGLTIVDTLNTNSGGFCTTKEIRLAVTCVPGCNATPGTWAGYTGASTEEILGGETRCSDSCQVEATMSIDVGGDDPGFGRSGWIYTGEQCESGVGNEVALFPEVESPTTGAKATGTIDETYLVPDSVTTPEGDVITGDELDDYWSYITQDYAVVQGQQAAEPINAPPQDFISITNSTTNNTQVINFYSPADSTSASNADALGPDNSNGPGADTFPGDGSGSDPEPGPGGQCDPDVEECADGLTGGVAACSEVPSCSDESAIECAILRQIHASNCETFAGEGPGADAVQELREHAGIAGDTDTALVGQLYRDAAEVDETGFFAALTNIPGQDGQACPAPLVWQAFGETREFPLDSICQFLRLMGVFVVLASVIAGLRIAMGSSK